MIINSASDVIYNGASVQALYYNGRQVWPVTRSAVSLTLRHVVYPTASSNTLRVTAHDPYTNIDMYGSLQSSFASSKWDYVPMNSDLTITCGRANADNSMFYFDDSAYYGTSLRIKANRDLDVSAQDFFSGKRFSASGYVYPLPYTQEISAQRWKLPLVVTEMSGCVWSAARTGIAEYTDLDGNVHSSSVPCSWIYCPDNITNTLQSSQYRFYIRHSSFITTSPSSSYPYTASVNPLFYIPEFTTSIDHGEQSSMLIGGNWGVPDSQYHQDPPTLLSASSVDVYWENDVNSPTVTSTASLYPYSALYSGDTLMRSFGTWRISGVWG